MARFKDQAICIRHVEWSETSQVVVLMSEQHGKVRGLAKGAKRTSPSSIQKFSGGVELLTRGEILGVLRSGTDLATLTEWDLQDDYHYLRQNLGAQRLAMYAADVVNALVQDEDSHPRTYTALKGFLEALGAASRPQAGATVGSGVALLEFQWALLEDAGFRPELWQDVHSGEAMDRPGTYTFDPQGGGLTRRSGLEDWRMRWQTVELLRAVALGEGDWQREAEPAGVERANRLLCAYLRWILDRELPTMRFVLGGVAGL